MIRYIIYFLSNMILSLVCYLTNPIVVLFSDEEGELPWILKGWQTWDDSLDVDWFVKETVPAVFRYDFDSKYERYTGTSENLQKHGRVRTYTRLKENAVFSFRERIQRYFCRVLWLYRNCGYGFAFWLFGADITTEEMLYQVDSSDYVYGSDGKGYFIYKNDRPFCKWCRWCIFAGWKIDSESGTHRAMIANRIAIRFLK